MEPGAKEPPDLKAVKKFMYRVAIAIALGVAITIALCMMFLPMWEDPPGSVIAKILLWPITAFIHFGRPGPKDWPA